LCRFPNRIDHLFRHRFQCSKNGTKVLSAALLILLLVLLVSLLVVLLRILLLSLLLILLLILLRILVVSLTRILPGRSTHFRIPSLFAMSVTPLVRKTVHRPDLGLSLKGKNGGTDREG
jgi:hypothetical protein